MSELQNPAPKIFSQNHDIPLQLLADRKAREEDPDIIDEFDKYEVYELLRYIRDPEHPLTLEQLNIIQPEDIYVDNVKNRIFIEFTPTIPPQTIGLTMRVKLARCLPKRFKVTLNVKPGTHSQDLQINKQIQDKERISAAMENSALINIVNTGLKNSDRIDS